MRFRYTKEHDQFLIDNVKGIAVKELQQKFNEHFNVNVSVMSIQCRKHKLNLKNGIKGGQFPENHVPWNKGTKGLVQNNKGCFQKHHKPKNTKPLGSERVDVYGYTEIKTAEPNKWELKHRWLYKQVYGEIPKNHVIIFLDQNKKNFNIDNLKAISRKENLIMNQKKFFSEDKDITNTGLMVAKLMGKGKFRK